MAALTAFESSVVVDNFAARIQALCVWRDSLVVGLGDGSLLLLEEPRESNTAQCPPRPWQVQRVHRGFAKRGGVTQLQAVTLAGRDHILSLSGALPAHACLELQPVCVSRHMCSVQWPPCRTLVSTRSDPHPPSRPIPVCTHTF